MRQAILSVLFFAALTATGVFVYQYFVSGTESGDMTTTEPVDERLAEYRKIRTLRPDLSVFADPFFKSLFSPIAVFGTGPVQPTATPGRTNPFTPF